MRIMDSGSPAGHVDKIYMAWYGMDMATIKMTFTLDQDTVRLIDDGATRLAEPKSQFIREAVADYHSRIGRLSESERQRMLKVFDTVVPLIPARPQREVEDELREIRRARRAGGRLSLSGKQLAGKQSAGKQLAGKLPAKHK